MRGMLRVNLTRGTIWTTLFAFGLMLLRPVRSNAAGAARYLYMLNCDGSYSKVDIATNAIVGHGNFLANPAVQALYPAPPSELGRASDCSLFNALYNPQDGTVYAELHSDRPSGARSAGGRASDWWLAAFRLPDLSLAAKAPVGGWSTLVVNPDLNELLAYNEDDSGDTPPGKSAPAQDEFYRLPKLEFLRARPVTEDDDVIAGEAYWWSAGQKIIDGFRILDSEGHDVKDITIDRVLTPQVKQQFQSLDNPCLGGPNKGKRRCLLAGYADSAGGRMLFIVAPDDSYTPVSRSAALLYSVSRGTVISSFPLPTPASSNGFTKGGATIRLTPDGQTVVAFETEHVQSKEKVPFWTP